MSPKSHQQHLSKTKNSPTKNTKMKKLLIENQNEALNSEGICEKSKITIEISDLEFLKRIPGMKGISLAIILKNTVKETKYFSEVSNKVILKEKFEL